MTALRDVVTAERERILAAHQATAARIDPDRYAPWQPAEMLLRDERKRVAARLLRAADVFPTASDACLEVGVGSQGWLGDLTTWGVPQRNLHGIDLDAARLAIARTCLPAAELRVGDAAELPWRDQTFSLVIASTVFSSVLDNRVRQIVADEIVRVLAHGGALLWYDFTTNSPTNPHVRKVTRRELYTLFARLSGTAQSVSLAPPLARLVVRWSWTAATILQAVPWLRTHLLAVLVKP